MPRLSGSVEVVSWDERCVCFVIFCSLTDDERNRDIGVLLDDGSDGVDVGPVLVHAIVGDGVLAVGGQSGTVTVGQVVDYESADDGRVGAGGVLRLDVG